MQIRPRRFWLRRPRRFFLLAFAAASLLALTERGIGFLASIYGPARGACWIWAAGVEPDGGPVAFYAAGDFELASPEPVRIAVAADEAYHLYLNGRLMGAGVYRPGSAIDRYRIDAALLRAGTNRITVRLQSFRGPGGFLAATSTVGSELTLTVTSDDWRIFRRHDPRLFDADVALTGGEAPEVWQRAPTGRWRLRPAADDLPLLSTADGPASILPARRIRGFHPEAPWIDLRRPRKKPFRFLKKLLDWGQEVEGLLSFELAAPASEPGLAYFAGAATDSEIPDLAAGPADAILLFVPGQTSWHDVRPRRFRYVLLVGVEPLIRARVQPLAQELAGRMSRDEPPAGVWGVRPPAQPSGPSELEEQVWQRVQALGSPQPESPSSSPFSKGGEPEPSSRPAVTDRP